MSQRSKRNRDKEKEAASQDESVEKKEEKRSLLPQRLLPMDLIEHTASFMPQPCLYLVASKCQIAKYDVAATGKYEIHTSLKRAIDRARKIFFDHVNSCWRGGIMDSCVVQGEKGFGPTVPCEFTLENVEKFDTGTLAEIWSTSDDCRHDCYGGVARVNVYKMFPFHPNNADANTDVTDAEFHHSKKSVVYTLPVRVDDEAEDEDEDDNSISDTSEDESSDQSESCGSECSKKNNQVTKEVYGLQKILQKDRAIDELHKKKPVKPNERRAAQNTEFI